MQAAFIHRLSSVTIRRRFLNDPAFRKRFEKKEVGGHWMRIEEKCSKFCWSRAASMSEEFLGIEKFLLISPENFKPPIYSSVTVLKNPIKNSIPWSVNTHMELNSARFSQL